MEDIQNSFCCGAVYGFLAAGVIGVVFNQMRMARLVAQRKDNPLDNFPDAAHPNMTASGIVTNSNAASIRGFLWALFLILFVGLVAYGVVVLFQ